MRTVTIARTVSSDSGAPRRPGIVTEVKGIREPHQRLEADVDTLSDLIKRALCDVPIACWGHFFPCFIAVWDFIEANFPGRLGELDCRYDGDLSFSGSDHVDWFLNELGGEEAFLDVVEAIMYPAVEIIGQPALKRGFCLPEELASLPLEPVKQLAEIVLPAARARFTDAKR